MQRIVILGGGFAGVRAALDLAKTFGTGVSITLIDQNSYHLFYPSLYEVASAYRSDTDPYSLELRRAVAIPFLSIFESTGVQVVQASVDRINIAQQTVSTRGGQAYPYDYLIVGLGTKSADFGIPGVREYAYHFKGIDDALMVNQRLQTIFYEAQHGQRALPLHIIVAGGGFTGVEIAAELASCASKMARWCGLERHSYYVTIVEAGKVMKFLTEKEQAIIRHRLTWLGVALVEFTKIQEVRDETVSLDSGKKLKSDMTIWAAGAKPHEMLQHVPGLETTSAGKMVVDEYLRIPSTPNVFAVGDAVEFINRKTNAPEAAMAYIAIEHGKTAATNIAATIRGRKLRPHAPPTEVWVAPAGGKFALAHLWGGLSLAGIFGWLLREIIDFRYFLTILPLKKAFAIFWHQTHEFTKND